MRAGYVHLMGETRIAYKILVGKRQETEENNIKKVCQGNRFS
jgi:hypothetical protein